MLEYAESQAEGVEAPYVEITQTDDGTSLTCELPQADAQDLLVTADPGRIHVKIVKNGSTTYSQTYETEGIDPDSLRISYVNGVLEIKAARKNVVF